MVIITLLLKSAPTFFRNHLVQTALENEMCRFKPFILNTADFQAENYEKQQLLQSEISGISAALRVHKRYLWSKEINL